MNVYIWNFKHWLQWTNLICKHILKLEIIIISIYLIRDIIDQLKLEKYLNN